MRVKRTNVIVDFVHIIFFAAAAGRGRAGPFREDQLREANAQPPRINQPTRHHRHRHQASRPQHHWQFVFADQCAEIKFRRAALQISLEPRPCGRAEKPRPDCEHREHHQRAVMTKELSCACSALCVPSFAEEHVEKPAASCRTPSKMQPPRQENGPCETGHSAPRQVWHPCPESGEEQRTPHSAHHANGVNGKRDGHDLRRAPILKCLVPRGIRE